MNFEHSRFHFVGIGGIGMCGLAELFHNMGAEVSGSDLRENSHIQRLEKLGVQISIGHSAQNVGKADVVVYSSAISQENPELKEAKSQKIPLIPRAEALAEVMLLKRGIAIAGTHGKTTTTSLAASVFLHAGKEPTIAVGGRLDLIQSTAHLGKGEWLIAEADESDGSFEKLSPEIAVITNIDNDHMDFYGSFENLQKAFYQFALKVPFYGSVILCGDAPETRKLFEGFPKKMITYGFEPNNDFSILGEKGQYQVMHKGKEMGCLSLDIPGHHNALNALASLVVGLEAGLDFESCAQGLKEFKGVDRRFQKKGVRREIEVYDDYGHHPTEVRASLQAFRERYPQRKLIVAFQPHRYTRTEMCWNEFVSCFSDADIVFILDIYPAGEKEIPNINSKNLAKALNHPHCSYLPGRGTPDAIIPQMESGDVFITMGAGDSWKLGEEILSAL